MRARTAMMASCRDGHSVHGWIWQLGAVRAGQGDARGRDEAAGQSYRAEAQQPWWILPTGRGNRRRTGRRKEERQRLRVLKDENNILDFSSAFLSPATSMAMRPGARSDVEAVKRCTATARQAISSSRHYCSSLIAQLTPSFSLDLVQQLDRL
jgi:hypothetical protein